MIKEIPLYATFTSQDALLAYIESQPSRDRAVMTLAMGLTWNLIAHLLAEAENESRPFGNSD